MWCACPPADPSYFCVTGERVHRAAGTSRACGITRRTIKGFYCSPYLVHVLNLVEGDFVLDVRREVLLVLGLVFLGEVFHVLRDVGTVDAVAVKLGLFPERKTRNTDKK